MGSDFRTYGYRRPSYQAYGGGGGGGYQWHITPTIKALIIANAAIYVAFEVLYLFSPPAFSFALNVLAMDPQGFVYGMLWQPLTYQFLHGNFWHLFFNMFGLWMFGMPLEREWGARRFLRFYLLAGIAAGIFSALGKWLVFGAGWASAAALTGTIGASGSLFGILAAFAILFPNSPVFVMLLFPIPARMFVLMFGIMQVLNTPAQFGSGGGVDFLAHLGGMIFGFFYLRGPTTLLFGARKLYANWQLNRARRKFRVYVREVEKRERSQSHPDDWVN